MWDGGIIGTTSGIPSLEVGTETLQSDFQVQTRLQKSTCASQLTQIDSCLVAWCVSMCKSASVYETNKNPFELQCIQEMGNGKANRLYEAYLPENFRRPQTDQHPVFLWCWGNTEPFNLVALQLHSLHRRFHFMCLGISCENEE